MTPASRLLLPKESAGAKLRDVLARHGLELFAKPRVGEIIRENLGSECKLEASLLNSAVQLGIPQRLWGAQPSSLTPITFTNIIAGMSADTGLKPDLATWAIEVWADALSIKTSSIDNLLLSEEVKPREDLLPLRFGSVGVAADGSQVGEKHTKLIQWARGPVLVWIILAVPVTIGLTILHIPEAWDSVSSTMIAAFAGSLVGLGLLWTLETGLRRFSLGPYIRKPLIVILNALCPAVLLVLGLTLFDRGVGLATQFFFVAYACLVAGITAPCELNFEDPSTISVPRVVRLVRLIVYVPWTAAITLELVLFPAAGLGPYGIGSLMYQTTDVGSQRLFFGCILCIAACALLVEALLRFGTNLFRASEMVAKREAPEIS
jgi:hypothetical protein